VTKNVARTLLCRRIRSTCEVNFVGPSSKVRATVFPAPGAERTGPGDREHAVAETALPPDATNGSVAGTRLKTTANCLTGHGDMRISSRIPGDSIDPARRT
jgi:hypothetical protein